MEIQKAIQIFLEKNNLNKTLQSFKKQSKRTTSITSNTNKALQAQLLGIQKFTLNRTNTNEIREHFQKTDEKVLRRTINKIKRNKNTASSLKQEKDIDKLTKMPFFKKLLEKQNVAKNEQQSLDQSFADLRESRSLINTLEESRHYENQWEGQNQIGYEIYECLPADLERTSAELAKMKQLNKSAIKQAQFPAEYFQRRADRIEKVVVNAKDKKKSRLPSKTIFPHQENQSIYPLESEGVTYDSFDLKIIYDREKTGFEQERDITIVINEVLAGRYQVVAVLGQAQFSKAIQVKDLTNNKHYCIKIIQNNKDYFDQSVDQIKLLRYISANCNTDDCNLLTFYDFFYHKEHLMLVTELLKDNLYDAYKMHSQHFTLGAIQTYAKQILLAVEKLHGLHIIHTDLKPQNILIKSYSKRELKVIDVGSSIFFHDKPNFYIQTRSYRAPEVILGCPYDEKIDVWSVGCIIAELFLSEVLFESDNVVGLLAKMQGLRGPWPSWMIEQGKNTYKYFTKDLVLFSENSDDLQSSQSGGILKDGNGMVRVYAPKHTNLKARLNCENKSFIDFLSKCLKLDPSIRLSAKEALKHPFLSEQYD